MQLGALLLRGGNQQADLLRPERRHPSELALPLGEIVPLDRAVERPCAVRRARPAAAPLHPWGLAQQVVDVERSATPAPALAGDRGGDAEEHLVGHPRQPLSRPAGHDPGRLLRPGNAQRQSLTGFWIARAAEDDRVAAEPDGQPLDQTGHRGRGRQRLHPDHRVPRGLRPHLDLEAGEPGDAPAEEGALLDPRREVAGGANGEGGFPGRRRGGVLSSGSSSRGAGEGDQEEEGERGADGGSRHQGFGSLGPRAELVERDLREAVRPLRQTRR